MSKDKEERQGLLEKLVVPVVVAMLAAGGTAPWWWQEAKNLFSTEHGEHATPTPSSVTLSSPPTPISRQEVTACSHLSVTASWDEFTAGQESNSCEYRPPSGWVIVAHKVEEHTKSNGSVNVSVEPAILKANVSAKAHGTFTDRKRGWIEVTVYATIQPHSL